jgi:pimeloyl-ACP methyl ester carboxylesterase
LSDDIEGLIRKELVRALSETALRELPERSLPSGIQRLQINITVGDVNSALEKEFHVSERDHLVILVHGIFTRAHWMNEVKPALEYAGFSVAPTSYGEYSLVRFLLPFKKPRRKAIERVVRDIHTARLVHEKKRKLAPRRMSVISHSFGTYVISRILDDHRELRWYRIIFCGSVVEEDYRLDRVLEQFSPDLLNEVGTRDFWPAFGESAGWGYGSIGSHGLNHPAVSSRWHRDFRHSDFLTRQFCQKFWIPFLRGEQPRSADEAERMPWWISAISRLQLRWIVLPVVLCWKLSVVLLLLGAVWWFGWLQLPWRW